MRKLIAAALGTAALWPLPAIAGEEPLYQPAPEWVQVAQLPVKPSTGPLVLLDDQRRIEHGRVWSYADRAFKIDNPQVLQGAGTVQAMWMPDKGDLIVHRVTIIRGDEQIDVLGEGVKFDVLRREQQLEARSIDGLRTGTLVVPGLRVGDILRVSYSVTSRDQALKDRAQAILGLVAKPMEVGLARTIVSWPADEQVMWKVSPGVAAPEPKVVDGFKTLSVTLPLDKAPEIPDDAPMRFKLPAMLQVSSFADWRDVSRTMSPLYATEGLVASGGPIADRVTKIEQAHTGQLERALAALRLVQDEISYLANGMNGGNYIPQAPAETWAKRFGDCKAKTLLLLAMLREMGIDAEPIVVASQTGDAVSSMLPAPNAFDHIIVHAVIDGTDYWLDGTGSGASMDVIGDVPPFVDGLPLRPEGADLLAFTPRASKQFSNDMSVTIDQRAGIDVPGLFEGVWTFRGGSAAFMNATHSQASAEQWEDFLQQYVQRVIGGHWLIDNSLTYDPQANVATVKASGLVPSNWKWQQGVGRQSLSLPTSDFDFRPDRSRPAWRDIPVKLYGPDDAREVLKWILPADGQAYTMEGKMDLAAEVASTRLSRHGELAGNVLTVTDTAIFLGGELPADQVAATRAKFAQLGSTVLTLRAPVGVERHTRFAGSADRKALAPIENAYVNLIGKDPADAARIADRAVFRTWTYDRDGALADWNTVIEMQPSANAYASRANLRVGAGDFAGALEDADAALGLEPSYSAASLKAEVLSYLGRADEGIALLEEQGSDPDTMGFRAMQIGDLEAGVGHKEQGLARLDAALEQRPSDPYLLNASCYFRAVWQVRLDALAEDCTRALEQSKWSAEALDSRAMSYFRLGRLDEALKDANAALIVAPEQTPTLYLRGLVRERMGDKGGKQDIRDALARDPSLKYFYGRFGIQPD